jgi:SAM-dependent MidA family methyltransferase
MTGDVAHKSKRTFIYNARMNPQTQKVKARSLPVPDDAALAQSSALVAMLHDEISAAGGWLPFDRYMERTLYAPGLGYYSGGMRKFGLLGEDGSDFVTAPELSPLFATTLARPIAQALAASGTLRVMEFGAGSGKLAAALLTALHALGVTVEAYQIVELSGELRARQKATIASKAGALAARVQWLDALPAQFEGVIVGNEVLDAMPVRLFARKNGTWFERGVVVNHATATKTENIHAAFRFENRTLTPASNNSTETETTHTLLATIEGEHDYVTETHDAALAFTRTVCAMLTRGAAFFIDYGFPAHEYYHPQRTQGTLMCHYRHRAHDDPFLYPGLQDITAHVEFSGIAQAGVETGADLLGYTSQARFLMNAGLTDVLAEIDPHDAPRFLPAANAVQKLVSEAEMGELFKVIAFSRGIAQPITAFAHGDRCHTL